MNTPIALITGGSRGLGKNTALKLAQNGIDVIFTYHHHAEDAHQLVNDINQIGRKAIALQLDVSSTKNFPAFAETLKETLHNKWQSAHFHFLVNNAGIGIRSSFAETTEEQFDTLINIHLKSVFFLTQAFLPLIADGGKIINVSSGLTRFTLPGYAAYASVKGGVEVLTRYMAKELGSRNISVNVIAPGAIETDFGGGAVRDNPQLNQFVASQTALGRAGLPDDIGDAIAALLSQSCRWINGQRIEASGGMFL